MSKYQNTKIYTIRSYENDDIYIGSTVEALSVRMSKHRSAYKKYLTGDPGYTSSFEILRYPTAYIELLEQYPCKNKDQKHAREGFHIRKMDCVNKRIAGRTQRQYKIDNVETIKQYKKQYYIDNAETIRQRDRQYSKQYRIDNADALKKKTFCTVCCGRYTHENKARHLKSKKHNDMCLDKLFSP